MPYFRITFSSAAVDTRWCGTTSSKWTCSWAWTKSNALSHRKHKRVVVFRLIPARFQWMWNIVSLQCCVSISKPAGHMSWLCCTKCYLEPYWSSTWGEGSFCPKHSGKTPAYLPQAPFWTSADYPNPPTPPPINLMPPLSGVWLVGHTRTRCNYVTEKGKCIRVGDSRAALMVPSQPAGRTFVAVI